MKRLEKLCQLPGVSGDEKEVRDYLEKIYSDLSLEIVKDRLGSIFAKQKGTKNRNLMISSNMDESGMMIQDLNEDGTLEFLVIGNYVKEELNERKIIHLSRTHKKTKGIVIRRKGSLVIDMLFDSKEDAEENGIQIGDFVILDIESELFMQQNIQSKNLSNRSGLELGIQILESNVQSDYNIFVGGIAHSVVGQRGAITATTVIEPDIALVIDAAFIKDAKPNEVYIRNFDKSMLPNQQLKQHLYAVAKKIGYTPVAHMGSVASDGSFIHKSLNGTPTIVLVLPLKYDNNVINSLDIRNLQNLKKLIVEFIKTLTDDVIEEMQYSRETRYEI